MAQRGDGGTWNDVASIVYRCGMGGLRAGRCVFRSLVADLRVGVRSVL